MLFLFLVTKKLLKSAVCAVGEVNNYYFEYGDLIVDMHLAPAKYCTYRGQNLDRVREHVWNAERIWVESENNLFYAKNRTAPQDKVDEKEFMWIKLKAKVISS